MFCPMRLDCQSMTGEVHNCPNLAECFRNSPLDRVEALVLYCLNLGKKPEDIRIDGRMLQYHWIYPQPQLPRASFQYNLDSLERDRIAFNAPVDWDSALGGAKHFTELSRSQLELLVERGFADPLSRQNESPSIQEFLDFARIQSLCGHVFAFEGYAIDPRREDYRVSIDGIVLRGDYPLSLLEEFQEFIDSPDELDIQPTYLRAWWD